MHSFGKGKVGAYCLDGSSFLSKLIITHTCDCSESLQAADHQP